MSKREHENLNGSGESGGSRHKRRREVGGSSSDVDVTMSDPIEPTRLNATSSSPELVKEQGLKLWTAVKDAANKEGRILSLAFLRKPPKRQYPDYYALIKEPIALDDIKKKLDGREYGSLEAVKGDFELLFSNARQYNQTESIIFQDAKELMKTVNKTYQKMVPGGDDEENGKPKPPTLHRLMKIRLEKLSSKKDPTGRVLSTEFMYLPSRKEWPIYYKEIKKPQCLDTIQRNIKRKEYQTSAQFAADVELVFANATTFNQDGTQIWNDAVALRDYFRQLMSDMPPPHSIPEYAKLSNKIKIRPPQAPQAASSGSTQPATTTKSEQTISSLLLRVPAAHPTNSPPKAAPQAPPRSTNQVPAAPVRSPAPPAQAPPAPKPQKTQAQVPAQPKAPIPQAPVQTVSFINATPSHYPRVPYAPPSAASTPVPAVSATPPVFRASSALNVNSTSQSPAPAPVTLPPSHQLKSIDLRIQPKGRPLSLDHRDGVKSWAIRLAPGETNVNFSNIVFIGDHADEDSSGDEDEADKDDDDFDMDVDVEVDSFSHAKNGRKKGKGRGRGRPPKAAAKGKAVKTTKKKPTSKIGEIQLKLNNFVVKEQPDQQGEWNVYLPLGSSVIEVGEVGGMIWKIYLERVGDS